MFDNRAFASLTSVLVGAILFGMLFEIPILIADFLIEGSLVLHWTTLVFGIAASVGYAAVGFGIRWTDRPSA